MIITYSISNPQFNIWNISYITSDHTLFITVTLDTNISFDQTFTDFLCLTSFIFYLILLVSGFERFHWFLVLNLKFSPKTGHFSAFCRYYFLPLQMAIFVSIQNLVIFRKVGVSSRRVLHRTTLMKSLSHLRDIFSTLKLSPKIGHFRPFCLSWN